MKFSISIFIIGLISCFNLQVFGQSLLPASWGFDSENSPFGWTESLGATNTRYANGLVGLACRLDATNDFVEFHFSETPGTLTYSLKGQNSGGQWQGSFEVQQSADGVTYSPVRTWTDGEMPTISFVSFTDELNFNTRYVRWYYSNKVTSHNLALDEVSLLQGSGLRYLENVFEEVSVTSDVVYGNNSTVLYYSVLGQAIPENLTLDIYEPANDYISQRPLLLYFHTGNFLPFPLNGETGGSKTDSAAVEICTRFARMGYVVASCDYRLGWNPLASSERERAYTLVNAIYRGIQDCRTAVRFFRQSAAVSGNPYGIDSNRIGVIGDGTGGYIALGAAAFDDWIEDIALLPKFNWDPTGSGSPVPMVIESINGNPDGTSVGINPLSNDTLCYPNHVGYSSDIQCAVNLSGALGDISWIEDSTIPIISFHVPTDPFFPYQTGMVIVPTTNEQVLEVSGSYDAQVSAHSFNNQQIFESADYWQPTLSYSTIANDRNNGLYGLFPFIRTGANIYDSEPWHWWDSEALAAFDAANGTANNANNLFLNPDMSAEKARAFIDTIQWYSTPRLACALQLPGSPCNETVGCTDAQACNYESWATLDNNSCYYPGTPCNDGNAASILDEYNINCICEGMLYGCMDNEACNYDSNANMDNGNCVYPGCLDFSACNFSFNAGCDDGSCVYPGCIDNQACNFSASAGCDDGSCLYPGCTQPNACNYSNEAGCDDGSCAFPGCNDINACNFQPSAGCNDGSCTYPGCTNPSACNYDSNAGCSSDECLFANTDCDDGNSSTYGDVVNSACQCAGTPFNYGQVIGQNQNVCPGSTPSAFQINAPLNIADYTIQWYYANGSVSCPSGNSLSGWNAIPNANGISYQPLEFTGTRTFACYISTQTSGIPAGWSNGCITVSYYNSIAQSIIGNPNVTPFSTFTYAVSPTSGMTYNWDVVNGAITTGQGTNNVQVLWGQSGPYEVTLNQSNGICSSFSSLLVVNANCNITVTAFAEGGTSFCSGEEVTLQATSDAVAADYQWYFNGEVLANTNLSALSVVQPGSYQVMITQGACTAVSQVLTIGQYEIPALPQIEINNPNTACPSTNVTLGLSSNSYSNVQWSNGENTDSIIITASGNYSAIITDEFGCSYPISPIEVNLALENAIPICLVTVNENDFNEVVWEPLFSDATAEYRVYKEGNTADQYEWIGSVPYGSNGTFIDVNSNPTVQANRYKLGIIDTCGTESLLTPFHKTIHLTTNLGINNNVNLIWSHYEGFNFGSYNIYRGDAQNNMTLLTTIASNLNSYTDESPLIGYSNYVIEVEAVSCDPTRDAVYSRSNTVTLEVSSIGASVNAGFHVYPNPSNANFSLECPSQFMGNNCIVRNLLGQEVTQFRCSNPQTVIAAEHWPSGIYFFELQGQGKTITLRCIKQ
jgi:hypothetical protein